ncbi:MAG: hypothetical protein WKG06_05860 [Segetibacter sp.]
MGGWCGQKSAEVVVLKDTSHTKCGGLTRQEGLNVRMAKQSGRLWQKRSQPKHISELPV